MKFSIHKSLFIIFLCTQFHTLVTMEPPPSENLNVTFSEAHEQVFDAFCGGLVESTLSYNNPTQMHNTMHSFNDYYRREEQAKQDIQRHGQQSILNLLRETQREYREQAAWEEQQRQREFDEMTFHPYSFLNASDQNSEHYKIVYASPQNNPPHDTTSDNKQSPHVENSNQDSDNSNSDTTRFSTNPSATVTANIPIFTSTLQINNNKSTSPTTAQSPRRSNSWPLPDQPSFDGLDNIPFLGPTETKRLEMEYRDAQVKTNLQFFLTDQTIPESYKQPLREMGRAYLTGELPLEQAEQEFHELFTSYKCDRLNELRLKDELTDTELNQRRALENEYLTPQDLSQSYIEEYEKLKQEYEDEVDHNVFIWHIFTNKLQGIKDRYNNKHRQLHNQLLDTISNEHKTWHTDLQRFVHSEQLRRRHAKERRQFPFIQNRIPFNSSLDENTINALEDCGTIIQPTDQDLLNNVHETHRATDFIITPQVQHFLNTANIDPQEFHNFHGTEKQNIVHKRLLIFTNSIQNFVINDDSELATKIREIIAAGFKAAYAMNQRNYTNLGLELLTICEKLLKFSIYPTRTITKEFINTLQNPIAYLEKRIENFIDTRNAINALVYDFSALSTKEKLSTIYDKVTNIEAHAEALLEHLKQFYSKSIRQHEEEFSQQVVDIVFDAGISAAVRASSILAKSSKNALKTAKHILEGHHAKRIPHGSIKNYIEVEINSIVHPTTPTTSQKAQNLLGFQKLLINRACKKISAKFKNSTSISPIKPPSLADFNKVIENFNLSKPRATRSMPYKVCKNILLRRHTSVINKRYKSQAPNTAHSQTKTTPDNTSAKCPASCPVQYENLKNDLKTRVLESKIREIKSVIDTTEHGLQRLIERNFDAKIIKAVVKTPDCITIQKDGAKVFIKKIEDEYAIIIYNSETKKVVSAIKDINLKDVQNLGKNHGWTFDGKA